MSLGLARILSWSRSHTLPVLFRSQNKRNLSCSAYLSEMQLDKNTFFIFSHRYPYAKLAQWGTGGRDVGTFEQGVHADQLWYLEKSIEFPEYYFMFNASHNQYRLTKNGSGDQDVIVYNGQYFEDQLWSFQKEGKYYRICNKMYPNAKLAKWGKDDSAFGTYSGPDYDNQLWQLVPRFQATAGEEEIWGVDNRGGSKSVTQVSTVTTGMKLTKSASLSTKFGYEYSLKSSLSMPIKGMTAGMETTEKFSFEISASISSAEERSWVKQKQTTFVAPPGKLYRVVQTILNFSSDLEGDNSALYCTARIEESS